MVEDHRQLIHATRDRNYKADGKIVAKNRHKRMGQKQDSLKEVIEKHGLHYLDKLTVLHGIKLIRRGNSHFRPGDVVKAKGFRHVVQGSGSKGSTLFLVGSKEYVLTKNCRRLRRNTGSPSSEAS